MAKGRIPMDLQACVNEILLDIRTIKKSKQVWLWIEKHAETVNSSLYRLAFGMIQRMAYIDIFAALGRIFESGRYSINTLEKELKVQHKLVLPIESGQCPVMVLRKLAHDAGVVIMPTSYSSEVTPRL